MSVHGIKLKKQVLEEFFDGATGPYLEEKYGVKLRTIYNWSQCAQREGSKLKKDIDREKSEERVDREDDISQLRSEVYALHHRIRALEEIRDKKLEGINIV